MVMRGGKFHRIIVSIKCIILAHHLGEKCCQFNKIKCVFGITSLLTCQLEGAT